MQGARRILSNKPWAVQPDYGYNTSLFTAARHSSFTNTEMLYDVE